MWFSAVPCLFCLAIGIIVSFASKAQNPKKLNPDLVSPMLPKLFSWWPFIGDKIGDWFENGIGLGIEYVSIMFCQIFICHEREWFPDTHFYPPYTHPCNNQYVTIIKHEANPNNITLLRYKLLDRSHQFYRSYLIYNTLILQ